MGQKMVRFGALRGTRSRQDESIEVCGVGSKRPSLGGCCWSSGCPMSSVFFDGHRSVLESTPTQLLQLVQAQLQCRTCA